MKRLYTLVVEIETDDDRPLTQPSRGGLAEMVRIAARDRAAKLGLSYEVGDVMCTEEKEGGLR